MQEFSWIIAALFLPLFPLGMIFNSAYQRIGHAWLRVLILLLWPLPGVWILRMQVAEVPQWVAYWALFSALLYGFRAVVIKEFVVWIGFLATSTWALNWVALGLGAKNEELLLHILAFSLPLSLLILLVAELEKRYESSYVRVIGGLAQSQPRLSALLVFVLLAAIGSPLFPAFFSMLSSISHALSVLPVIALGVVIVWLLWSWSGISLLQDLLVGNASKVRHKDVSHVTTLTYAATLVMLIIAGLHLSRILL